MGTDFVGKSLTLFDQQAALKITNNLYGCKLDLWHIIWNNKAWKWAVSVNCVGNKAENSHLTANNNKTTDKVVRFNAY